MQPGYLWEWRCSRSLFKISHFFFTLWSHWYNLCMPKANLYMEHFSGAKHYWELSKSDDFFLYVPKIGISMTGLQTWQLKWKEAKLLSQCHSPGKHWRQKLKLSSPRLQLANISCKGPAGKRWSVLWAIHFMLQLLSSPTVAWMQS